MRVSIVVPAYDAAKYLSETVESALVQTLSDWEMVIVNDGSRDGTAEVAERYASRDARIRVVHQANEGLPGARNRGYAETSVGSPYVIFLDADDVWEPDTLELLEAALQQNPDAVAAHGVARFIDGNSRLIQTGRLESCVVNRKAVVGGRIRPWPAENPTTFAVLAINCYIVSAGMVLVRRTCLDQVGLFDPMKHLPRASLEDWDLWLRLSAHGDFAFVPKIVLNYRRHLANLSKAGSLMDLGDFFVRSKTLSSPSFSSFQRQMMLISNQHRLASYQRRNAYHQFMSAKSSLFQGEMKRAVGEYTAGLCAYGRYVKLRRARHADPRWVNGLLEKAINELLRDQKGTAPACCPVDADKGDP